MSNAGASDLARVEGLERRLQALERTSQTSALRPNSLGPNAEAVWKDYTKEAHGFAVNDVVVFKDSDWAKAESTDYGYGVVIKVFNANRFRVMYKGVWVKPGGSFTADESQYIDPDTAGAWTTTENGAYVGRTVTPEVMIVDCFQSGSGSGPSYFVKPVSVGGTATSTIQTPAIVFPKTGDAQLQVEAHFYYESGTSVFQSRILINWRVFWEGDPLVLKLDGNATFTDTEYDGVEFRGLNMGKSGSSTTTPTTSWVTYVTQWGVEFNVRLNLAGNLEFQLNRNAGDMEKATIHAAATQLD